MPRSRALRALCPRWVRVAPLYLLLWGGGLWGSWPAQAAPAPGPFLLQESNATGLRLAFAGEPVEGARSPDGTLIFRDRRHPEAPSGSDLYLPWATAYIALPPGARLRCEVRLEAVEPAAWPDGTTGEEMRQVLLRLPPEGLVVGDPCWTCNQWGCPLRFCPVIPDGRGGLRRVLKAEIQVGFSVSGSQSKGAGAGDPDDPMAQFYDRQFLNAREAAGWRRVPPEAVKAARPVTGDYFTSTPNPWIKVYVSRRGCFEIRGEDLRALGLTLSAIDPATLRLFCPPPIPLDEGLPVGGSPSWMREIPIEVVGGEDGTFDATDALRFVGTGPDGWFEDLGVPATPLERAFRDPYNNENVYWLTWGGQFVEHPQPLRIRVQDRRQLTTPTVTSVVDRAHFEKDLVWNPRPKDSPNTGATPAAWDRFHWVSMTANSLDQSQLISLDPPDPLTDRAVTVHLRLWGNSFNEHDPGWPDHEVKVTLNGHPLPYRSWYGLRHLDIDSTGTNWLVPGEQELRILLPYHPVEPAYAGSARSDQVDLGWVELDYWRQLEAHGDSLSFFAGGWTGSQTLELNGFSRNDVLLFDTSDPWAPVRLLPDTAYVAGRGTRALFRATLGENPPSRFLACTPVSTRRPRMELDTPPEGGYLRLRTDAVQGLVVAPSGFLAAAQKLADFRRDHFPGLPGARVEVVDVQDIMDEFSFGRQDPTALRGFLQFASAAWTGGRPGMGPAYVVLLGDAYFDFRGFLGRGARSIVPTYEGEYDSDLALNTHGYSPQFASDDYFGYLDGLGDTGLDLFVGRLPARTLGQASAMVDKIINLEGKPSHYPWRGRVTLIADDICQGTHPDDLGFLHMEQTEELPPLLPASVQVDKIYLYEYGPACVYDRKPAAAEALQTRIREGTLLVNFTGHGSEQQLADERVLETGDVATMTNADSLFVFFTASCSVGMYDFAGEGLGEALILRPSGGAIAVFSASAVAYSQGNANLNQAFFSALFPDSMGGQAPPIGQAAALAKAGNNSINSRRYVLLGDPAVRLASPRLKVDLALKEARTQAALGDTLVRGMMTELTGRVVDDQGNQVPGFDGSAWVRIYDSALLRRPVPTRPFTYTIRGAPIFQGRVPVAGGAFSLRFKVPSALATGNGGKAEIHVYVADANTDGQGAIPRIGVPSRAVQNADGPGPAITLEVEGDPHAVSPQAAFFATLKDSSGINITDLVKSRSVLAQFTKDGDPVASPINLSGNVVFPAGYDSAQVSGTLPAELQPGESYDLTLRATNNLMKESHAQVHFTMAGGGTGAFDLRDLFNFPNPGTGRTTFFGTLNRAAEISVEVYTISGRRIWRLQRPVLLTPEEWSGKGIYWNGRDAEGSAVANGVYLYKVTARPADGGPSVSRVERMVVYRER